MFESSDTEDELYHSLRRKIRRGSLRQMAEGTDSLHTFRELGKFKSILPLGSAQYLRGIEVLRGPGLPGTVRSQLN